MRHTFYPFGVGIACGVLLGLPINAKAQRVYWSESQSRAIKSACLTGRQIRVLTKLRYLLPIDVAVDAVGKKLYWVADAASADGAVQRANLDGSGVETLVTYDYASPTAIAIDPAGGKFYWADGPYGIIERANLDGSGRQIVVQSQMLLRFPHSLALDLAAGKIYWVDGYNRSIYRANMSGGGVETVIHYTVSPTFNPGPIAIDSLHGKLYWTGAAIHRANLDGSQMEDLVAESAGPIILDVDRGKMYWSGPNGLRRANLDGSAVEVAIAEIANATALAVDLTSCGNCSDCQPNGIADDCDICAGVSDDCNLDDIPDTCDLAQGVSPDCNGNFIPDECDIGDAASADCNFNDVPDECEIDPYCANQGHACQSALLRLSDGEQNDQFGTSVSLHVNRAVIGARQRTISSMPETGAVYVYHRVGRNWIQEAAFTSDDAETGDRFGWSVSHKGDRIVVGAPFHNVPGGGKGAAYVFVWNGSTWVQEAKLVPADGNPGRRLGTDVALNGDTAVIGAGFWDETPLPGIVYVFERVNSTWMETATLAGASPTPDGFGFKVDLHGPCVVVGAYYEDHAEANAGAAYVFRRDSGQWVREARLTAPTPREGDYFGWDLALHGDAILVGATGDDLHGENSGAAYVYRRAESGWQLESTLRPTGIVEYTYLGFSVSLEGDAAVIASRNGGQADFDSPSLYWFRRIQGQWVQEVEFPATGSYLASELGQSVSLEKNIALVGAPYFYRGGSAMVFTLDDPDCDGDGVFDDCDADCNSNEASDVCDILTGISLDVLPASGNGIPDECEQDCNGNGIPDPDDISSHASPDCNRNGIPDECDVDEGTSPDCDENDVPDECQPDCNNNDRADVCDISLGQSADCNSNGKPDECEPDCNTNDVADSCDIRDGTSGDTNGNKIPDECEPVNDLCANALPVVPGVITFNNTWATTEDSPYLYECNVYCEGPCMTRDVWYEFTPECSGEAEVVARAPGPYYPTLILYDGCYCPPRYGSLGCSTFFSSPVRFFAVWGNCYKIRLGNGLGTGSLSLTISPPCYHLGNGDVDDDGDVDLEDFANWQDCVTGPKSAPESVYLPHCGELDLGADGDIDLNDIAKLFLRLVTK